MCTYRDLWEYKKNNRVTDSPLLLRHMPADACVSVLLHSFYLVVLDVSKESRYLIFAIPNLSSLDVQKQVEDALLTVRGVISFQFQVDEGQVKVLARCSTLRLERGTHGLTFPHPQPRFIIDVAVGGVFSFI